MEDIKPVSTEKRFESRDQSILKPLLGFIGLPGVKVSDSVFNSSDFVNFPLNTLMKDIILVIRDT